MADMMVIVKQTEFRKVGKDARVGDVLAIDRYVSTNPALAPIARGGRLLLVTVVPEGEKLWLVAVLNDPKRARGAYRAENATPITDLTKLRSKLRFTTGKGLSPKAGALGMSLQTPRTLTPADTSLVDALLRAGPKVSKTHKASKAGKASKGGKKTPKGALDAAAIATKLGDAFRAVASNKHEAGLVQVEHVPSGTLFVAIAAATYDKGPSARDAKSLEGVALEEDISVDEVAYMAKEKGKPTRVEAFLCARAPVSGALAERVLGRKVWEIDPVDPSAGPARMTPMDAAKLAKAFAGDGLRLLTDTEWELVARDGDAQGTFVNATDAKGAEKACRALFAKQSFDRNAKPPTTNTLGVWGLPWGDFVAASAKAGRIPWGVRGGAAMVYPWQTDEIMMCLATFGYPIGKSKDESGVRFAVSL